MARIGSYTDCSVCHISSSPYEQRHSECSLCGAIVCFEHDGRQDDQDEQDLGTKEESNTTHGARKSTTTTKPPRTSTPRKQSDSTKGTKRKNKNPKKSGNNPSKKMKKKAYQPPSLEMKKTAYQPPSLEESQNSEAMGAFKTRRGTHGPQEDGRVAVFVTAAMDTTGFIKGDTMPGTMPYDTSAVVLDNTQRSGREVHVSDLQNNLGTNPRSCYGIAAKFLNGPFQEFMKILADPLSCVRVNNVQGLVPALKALRYSRKKQGNAVRDSNNFQSIKSLTNAILQFNELNENITWEALNGMANVVGQFRIEADDGSVVLLAVSINQDHKSPLCCRNDSASMYVNDSKWLICLTIGRRAKW